VSNVGIDVYNWYNDDSNVPAFINFARSQGEPVSFDELGLMGSDDASSIDTVAGIVRNPANDVTPTSQQTRQQ
jgi:hypothetical protein